MSSVANQAMIMRATLDSLKADQVITDDLFSVMTTERCQK
jgi:hypothetical protein